MDRMLKGAFLALALAGAVLTGCGGGGSSGGTGEKAQGVGAPQEGKAGGKLTVLWTDDVDNIDSGISYYQMGYWSATRRSGRCTRTSPTTRRRRCRTSPTADPQVSEDGKTVTVKIRSGVKFSPPVNREVTSADVKYAIERGFFNTVNDRLRAAPTSATSRAPRSAPSRARRSPGIKTPDDQTIVFKLKRADRRRARAARSRCR